MATNNPISVTDAVADALCYYRYRGASLTAIDSYAGIRSKDFNSTRRNEALTQLQSDGYAEKRGSLWFLQPDAFKSARGDSYAPEFEDMDFAIAFAVLGSGDKCDLKKLIGTFDFVVRALPSFDELYGGLNRLAAARLIKRRRAYYEPTQLANDLFATAKNKSKNSMYDQLQAFTRLVLCPCCGAALKRVTWRVPLAEKEFADALKDYKASRK